MMESFQACEFAGAELPADGAARVRRFLDLLDPSKKRGPVNPPGT
jgi:hypothetical protein